MRYAQRFQQREEEKRRLHEAVLKAAAERYRQGLQEVIVKAFDTEDFVEDSFGRRWLKCERCNVIKQKDEFSLIGRLHRPSIGICTDCARKME